jgi:PAS domain S-box-containing protein
VRKDGAEIATEVNAAARWNENGDYQGHICVVRDITRRKQAEEAIASSETRFRSLFEESPISLWDEDLTELQRYLASLRARGVADFDAFFAAEPAEVVKCIGKVKVIAVNRATLALYEAADQSTLLSGLARVFTEESIAAFRDAIVAVAKGVASYECEAVNQTLSGRKLNVLLRWSLLGRDSAGRSRALVSVVDITERKQAEEQVRLSEQFIRNILDTVDEGFIVIDQNYRILTANKAYCGQAGLPCDEVIGRNCFDISHKASRPCYEEGEDCAVRNVFATGEPHAALHKHKDRDGHDIYVETKAFPVKDGQGNVTSAIETVNNITEKHLLEQERLKTQKLESIGTLAGGIAHDFNNLLQGVFGYISMARLDIDDRTKSLEALEEAEKALHLSVKLTNQLLTFSKGGKPVRRPTDLRPLIENAVKFALSGSRTECRIVMDRELLPAEADDGQISQVIQNIVLNADQAMPSGGTVTVAGRNITAPGEGIPAHLTAGRYVEIAISDTGIGIAEQYLSRIFDPYFTTKEKGSGLGLATSYSIMKNHGGAIEARSAAGAGTTFLLYLPASPAASGERSPAALPAAGRRGRVLVMDDEEMVRKIAAKLIQALGHDVDVAPNGDEALAKYRSARDAGRTFDVVILDLTVRGGMGGADAARKLLELDPSVNMVVSSGYSDDEVTSNYREHGFRAFLKKPYDVDELRRTLNALTG